MNICNQYITFALIKDDNKVVRKVILSNEFSNYYNNLATDNANFVEATQVILLNSFLKKDNKQYKREIEKARIILVKEELI